MRIRNWLLVSVLASCGTVALTAATLQEEPVKSSTEEKKDAATDKLHPRVTMKTSLGDIVIELNAEKAPLSTENFLLYARDGFYNGTIFHRVMNNFMIQGGGFDPQMDKKEEGIRKPIANEWKNGLKNKRGAIAMARLGGQPDSATAQFFINVVDNAPLDMNRDGAAYAVFGEVVEGMDVVDKIRNVEVVNHPKYPSPQPVVPKETIVIKDVSPAGNVDWKAIETAANAAREKQGRAAAEEAQAKEDEMKELKSKIEGEAGGTFQKTNSGLMYLIENEGSGTSPTTKNRVKVNYRGTLMDGTQFDSSYDRGEPIEFPLGGVIMGWQEGVAMMKPGGKAHFIIPPDLAYGERGAPGAIPPNSTLYFQVELLEVK
ncbi:MAG: peptidylprolyl isomerase [Phycisphaerae bacterium]